MSNIKKMIAKPLQIILLTLTDKEASMDGDASDNGVTTFLCDSSNVISLKFFCIYSFYSHKTIPERPKPPRFHNMHTTILSTTGEYHPLCTSMLVDGAGQLFVSGGDNADASGLLLWNNRRKGE